MGTLDSRCLVAYLSSGIGNVTTNTTIVEMAMACSRCREVMAAGHPGVGDASGAWMVAKSGMATQ
jgi:hypothetical protein